METENKNIIKKIVSDIRESRKEDIILTWIENDLEDTNLTLEQLSKYLYVLSSIYLIDEITTQPTSRDNFIDMSSYYFRSESYSMDFPDWLHTKYNVPILHLDREKSLFFSNKNYIENFLGKKSTGEIGNISYICESDQNLKIPSSRQTFLVELFKTSPESLYTFYEQKFNPKLLNSQLIDYRNKVGYSEYLYKRTKNLKEVNFKEKLKILLSKNENFILTSSGTASNFLISKYLDNENRKSYYHKYWYYENITNQETLYFFEIKDRVLEYENFYFNIEPSNYFDLEKPEFFEDIGKCIDELLKSLGKSKKEFNLVIDSTSNPFVSFHNIPENVHIFKTISLSKYQEGLNTNFVGIVITNERHELKLNEIAKHFGFALTGLDKEFCYIPEMSKYKERNSIIYQFNQKLNLEYLGWRLVQVGLSYVLLPNKSIVEKHIKKFALQTKLNDRMFTWEIRKRINNLIKENKMSCFSYGDSFLFPASRVVIQGPQVDLMKYVKKPLQKAFKYRLPRISLGYKISKKEIKNYITFNRDLINLIMKSYDEL